MKNFTFFICLLLTGFVCSQSNVSVQEKKSEQLTPLASKMIKAHYTTDEIAIMKSEAPYKLAALNYYYSNSFSIKEGQKYTQEQWLKIDIAQLDKYRDHDKSVEVLDPNSKLYLILDAQLTMKSKINEMLNSK
jgi:hypothetical protein